MSDQLTALEMQQSEYQAVSEPLQASREQHRSVTAKLNATSKNLKAMVTRLEAELATAKAELDRVTLSQEQAEEALLLSEGQAAFAEEKVKEIQTQKSRLKERASSLYLGILPLEEEVAVFYSTVGATTFYSTVRGLLLSQITAFYFTAKVAAFYSTVGVTAFCSIIEVTTFYSAVRRWLLELIGASPFCNPFPVRPRAALVGLHCLNDVDLLGMLPSSASIVTLAYLMMTSAAWACRCQLQRSLPTKDGKDQ
ncbi:hypothetical protein Taro_014227, partial [Colocasia esculenta]|nr:hypothetical protein [Colocasia esculenta]